MPLDIPQARVEVFALMAAAEPEPAHARQVARLALRLYDDLVDLHGGGAEERFLLEAAGLLHDIGWSVARDGKSHHKHSARLIREAVWAGLPGREVAVVAQIARYHRKRLPDEAHDDFMALAPPDREWVEKLAGLLRIADGLDRQHLQKVVDIAAAAEPERVVVAVRGRGLAQELAAAKAKADLAVRAFKRSWSIQSA